MPLLSTLGAASLSAFKGSGGLPTVSGGTTFQDATYYYRTFTTNDTLNIVGGAITADILIVGGGGGGGGWDAQVGATGGSGAAITASGILPAGAYSIAIGNGGAGGSGGVVGIGGGAGGSSTAGFSGGSGGAAGATGASGGGGGGGSATVIFSPSSSPLLIAGGGAGGGGATEGVARLQVSGGGGTQAMGANGTSYAGGAGFNFSGDGGGGGGGGGGYYGGLGQTQGTSLGASGGGNYVANSVFSTSAVYAGTGGTPAAGSTSAIPNTAATTVPNASAFNYTNSMGYGGGAGTGAVSPSGGSGIVIVRYLKTAVASTVDTFELIGTVILTSPQASVTFTGIPQTYKHLQVRIVSSDSRTAASNSPVYFQANGVATATYTYHQVFGNGTSVTSYGSPSAVSVGLTATSGASGNFGVNITEILDYTSTTKNKTTRALGGSLNATGGSAVVLESNAWLSTAAISSLSFVPFSGVFASGSRFSLYGVRG